MRPMIIFALPLFCSAEIDQLYYRVWESTTCPDADAKNQHHVLSCDHTEYPKGATCVEIQLQTSFAYKINHCDGFGGFGDYEIQWVLNCPNGKPALTSDGKPAMVTLPGGMHSKVLVCRDDVHNKPPAPPATPSLGSGGGDTGDLDAATGVPTAVGTNAAGDDSMPPQAAQLGVLSPPTSNPGGEQPLGSQQPTGKAWYHRVGIWVLIVLAVTGCILGLAWAYICCCMKGKKVEPPILPVAQPPLELVLRPSPIPETPYNTRV